MAKGERVSRRSRSPRSPRAGTRPRRPGCASGHPSRLSSVARPCPSAEVGAASRGRRRRRDREADPRPRARSSARRSPEAPEASARTVGDRGLPRAGEAGHATCYPPPAMPADPFAVMTDDERPQRAESRQAHEWTAAEVGSLLGVGEARRTADREVRLHAASPRDRAARAAPRRGARPPVGRLLVRRRDAEGRSRVDRVRLRRAAEDVGREAHAVPAR